MAANEIHADPGAGDLAARAVEALRGVVDPEVGLDVVSLGLVYGVEVDGDRLTVALTMTTPACPLGEHIALDAERRLQALDGVGAATVHLVWDPPWSPERMAPEARAALGWED